MLDKHLSGIYIIQNTINNHMYIGSSVNIKGRFFTHKSMLKRSKHHSKFLQSAWNKYGESNFIFKIILICEPFELLRYEQLLLDKLKPEYNCFLIVDRPTGLSGRHHSQETKDKIGAGNKGKIISENQREAVALANKRRIVSDETRLKMSIAKSGNKNPAFGKNFYKLRKLKNA